MNAAQRRECIAIVRQLLRDTATPGAAVVLNVDGQIMLAEGIGFRDLEQTAPLPSDAQFYIYSVTKMLLAAITLQLAAEERIALDAPVQDYLPALPLDASVSIRQLLNHTAGLPDYGGMQEYVEALRDHPRLAWTSDEFFARTLPHGLCFAPAHGWAYSNIGFLIIRLLIEDVTGQPLKAAVEQRIVGPLGLERTFVAETLEDAVVLAPGYSTVLNLNDGLADVVPIYHPGWVSHGVVVSNALELARITDALFTGQLFASTWLRAMLEPVLVPIEHPLFGQPAYGLGVMLDRRSPYGIVAGHGGGGPGYSTAALHFTDVAEHRVTSVALANRDGHDLGLRIAFAFAEAFQANLT